MECKTPEILTASLRVINLHNLLHGIHGEAEKLVLAAKEDGIFYVDFTGHASSPFTGLVDEIYSLSRSLFDLDIEEKMQYDVDQMGMLKLNGYKPISRNIRKLRGMTPTGSPPLTMDKIIPHHGIFSVTNEPFPRPAPIDEHWQALQGIVRSCRDVAGTIFRTMSTALHLPADKTFESFHHPCHASLDIIRLLKYQSAPPGETTPRVPQTAHTDLGSLTMLFASTPGLQICPRGSDDWLYVMPRANSMIVNLGDAMSIWTDGVFQNVLHRVSSMPGQAMEERYSFAVLMRPADGAPMVSLMRPSPSGLEAEPMRCDIWLRAKFLALRGQKNGERKDSDIAVLTGCPDGRPRFLEV
ncbi:hypothetical protein KXX33_009505 [Aspergillus fumigatus]|nr:hypothetical protein KXX30_009004 [Aspergillus fumigatus]KAH1351425.1 hypothetical protein KXX33_009505 [Aspergillus fumigatus]KAH1358436.1 hypothetical protein KXX63_008427 [Aspergillus fumigatus]KAH1381867.1 hypothetical protein KXX50_007007 [Aspergillus fumigatus]KAH1397535.1 hypothetical protein KXX49_006178 [Aspergillus fumigatus]